jgi:LysM repeat protein
MALNNLSSAQAQSLQPGLTLSIPQSGTFPGDRALHAHPVSYTVPSNTNVYGVACFFGDVDPATIISANNIADPNNIPAGTVLQID